MSRLIPDPNYPETPLYGMNTYDSDKTMVSDKYRGYYNQLVNTFPGTSQKPRKAVNDLLYDNTLLGFNNTRTMFKSKGVHYHADGNDYVFVWSQSIDNRSEYNLEMWDLTSGTRSILESGTFESEDVYFTMIRLYNSIYCTANYTISTNHSSLYRGMNLIIDYVNGSFEVRQMGIDESPVVQDRYVVEASASSVFDERHLAGAIVFNEKLWLIGGEDGSNVFKSVHSSDDGKLWTTYTVTALEYVLDEDGSLLYDESGEPIVDPATFVKRKDFGIVVFDNKLWIFGGVDENGTNLNDAWYTEDGSTWYLHDREAEWDARYGFGVSVHSGKVYITGGYTTSAQNDVWYTSDFRTWTQVTVSTAFTARYGHTMLSYNGYLWILIGSGVTNTYQSSDLGVNWIEVNADIGLGQREYHASVVFENKMWILGGNSGGTRQNNVYSSTDGDTWTTVDSSADWDARSGHCAAVLLNKIFVYCGYSGTAYYNDVWSSSIGSSWALESTGLTAGKYYSYATTFVRRTDTDSTLDSIDNFEYEAWETYNGQTVSGVDEILLPGTVSLSGTALTGAGTSFSSLTVGQHLRIDGIASYYTLTAITDDTNATVSNDGGDSYTTKEFALLPSAGESITTDEYEDGDCESIEDTGNRVVVYNYSTNDTGRIFHNIPFRSYDSARDKGATHIRIYRTLGADDINTARGLDHRYCIDVSIEKISNIPTGQYEYKVWRDGIQDDVLENESNLLLVTGYEVPPLGRYCAWIKGTLWIAGDPDTKGFLYRSELATGKNPKKWSTMFDTTSYYNTFDPEDGQEDTGIKEFNGDLYFWKERKLLRLPNANIENNPESVSDTIGCICPDTIVSAEVPMLGGACVFFLSELGPAVLTSGGVVRILREFKIAELYHDKTGIINDSTGTPVNSYTRNKVQAEFHNNSYIVTIGDSEDSECSITTNKVFGMFFDIDQNAIGGYQMVFGTHDTYGIVFEPQVFIRMKSYLIGMSHKRAGSINAYRLTNMEDRTLQEDTFLGGASNLAYTMTIEPRYIPIAPLRNLYGEVKEWKIYIDYSDEEDIIVTVQSHFGKFSCPFSGELVRSEGIFKNESLIYRDSIGGTLYEGLVGRNANLLIAKVVPSSGDVEYSGYELYVDEIVDDREQYIMEGSSVIENNTFTVDANAAMEENAYA